MKDQLIAYVDLLFAGAPEASDIKQEILQNTLDRYDDLLMQGKSAQAAYSLAISGIGDINEILHSEADHSRSAPQSAPAENTAAKLSIRQQRAIAIAMYILCPIPLFILSEFGLDTVGLCLTLLLVAAATVLMTTSTTAKKQIKSATVTPEDKPESELHKAVKTIWNVLGLCVYLAVSFSTGAWWITWLIFPIMAACEGLVKACFDLKEACKHEN